MRPLSQVEIIPMPYVTESTKVNIILPVTVQEADSLTKFLGIYEKVRKGPNFLSLKMVHHDV